MRRAITVIIATLILLAVGFYLGQRPVKPLRNTVDQLSGEMKAQVAQLQKAQALADARADLYQASSELYAAAAHATRSNFGLATEKARHAGDLITRASAVPGVDIDTSAVQSAITAALEKLTALDASARDVLESAAEDLARLLDQRHA